MRLPISKIKPNPNNPRLIKDDKFKKLVQSIKDFPEMLETREIVVNKDHVILGGNMRFKAAKEAGLKEIPVKIVDWDEDKQRQFIIKDNVSGGEWDWDVLANEWNVDELNDWGLDVPDDWLEQEPEIEEDEAPEVSDEPPVSKLGEVYQLGRHRVMCGDSTDKANVELLMNGQKADMVLTDPPYGMDLDTDYSKMSGNEGSGKKYDAGIVDEFRPEMIDSIVSLDADEVFIWGADYFAELLPKKNDGSWIVWDKRESEETGKNVDKRFGSMFELCWSKKKHKRDIIRFMWAGMMKQSDYDTGRSHPTQKPAKLSAIIIQKYGNEKAIIVDLFLGSGSTLIACEQTDRTCYGMELDPKYVDVIRKRYWKFVTGSEEGWAEATPAI